MTFYLFTSHFVNLSAFVASVEDPGKNRAIIYIFSCQSSRSPELNQNTADLPNANLFPVDMPCGSAQDGDQ